jgi:hypothetical protein
MTDIPHFPEMHESMATPRSASDFSTESPGIRPSPYFADQQEEGILRDVLEELDRERHNRAELEAKVRVLEQELHSQRRTNTDGAKASVKDFITVLTERDGYKEILDALTQDRPAFTQQVRSSSSLPIHIIRLLEVMPWDSRAQQYMFGLEQVYEWQVYSADKKWHKELRFFPAVFKSLPIVVPSPGIKTVTEQSSKHFPFGGGVAPPKQCVLTNLEATTILNIDKGYPLPESDGGDWTWVGPWRIGKSNDTDERGWSYSNEVEILSDPSTYYCDFRVPEKGRPNMVKRRRKWTRLRVLIDYPYASTMTKEYLKLVADKARLDGSVDKLAGQLVELKMGMTQLEANHLAYQEKTDARIRELTRELEDRNKILGLVEHGAGLQLTGNRGHGDSMSTIGSSESGRKENKDQVAEIRSAVTQWVSNTVQKRQQTTSSKALEGAAPTIGEGVGADQNGSSNSLELATGTKPHQASDVAVAEAKQQLFESLRDKGTGLFEKWKQKGEQELDKIKHNGGPALPWQRKEQNGGNHKGKESAGAIGSGSSSTHSGGDVAAGVDPNVYVPVARSRLQSR